VKECGLSSGSGTFSLSATAETTTTGRLLVRVVVARVFEQGIERGDAEADEVRRRREVRLVRDAAARVEADGPRREPVSEVGGEVTGLAVVAGHDERGLPARERVVDAVEEARDEVGAQARGDNARPPFRARATPSGLFASCLRSGLRAMRACAATALRGSRGRAFGTVALGCGQAARTVAMVAATLAGSLVSARWVTLSVR
jgi:hypothetical protein